MQKEDEAKKIEEKNQETKANDETIKDSTKFKDIKDLNITHEEPFSFTSETTSKEEKDKFE